MSLISKYSFHLTLNEKRFVEETLAVLSIRNPEIKKELDDFVTKLKEPKDRVSCKQQVINFLFKKRYPVITKKLKLLNRLKIKLKNFGIKIFYDKMLEQEPKIVLSNGKEVRLFKFNCTDMNKDVQKLIKDVFEIFYTGI